jgi:uncharacterized delta-60 repeat protein
MAPPIKIVTNAGLREYLRATAKRTSFFLMLALAGLDPCAFGNTGDLDPSFGDGGSGYLNFSNFSLGQTATAVLSQPDGDVIVVGNLDFLILLGPTNGSNAISVARLLPDGSLDPTFGDTVNSPGQTTITDAESEIALAYAAALTPDGHIIIAGSIENIGIPMVQQASVWRLTTTGALDTSFGGGTGQVSVGQSAQFGAVLVGDGSNLAENELVLGGYQLDTNRNHNSQIVVRMSPDGAIETGYGNASFASGGDYWVGGVQCPNSQSDSEITALAFNPQFPLGFGSSYLYAAGNCSSPSVVSEATVIAYTADTIADTTFGGGGLGFFTFGSSIATEPSFATGMQTHVSSTAEMVITIAGYVEESAVPGETHYGVAQVLKNGHFNTAFGAGGAITYDLGECCTGDPKDMSKAVGVLVQRDGRVVVGISRSVADGSEPSFALARLTTSGRQDASFAVDSLTSGFQSYSLNEFGGAENDSYSVPVAMGFTAGEKILLAGYLDDGSGNNYFAVARIDNDRIFTDGFDGVAVPAPE